MNPSQFTDLMLALRAAVPYSVTSFGRTIRRNQTVGGKEHSKHLVWQAMDIVLDDDSDRQDLYYWLDKWKEKGLITYLEEGDHVHVQCA